MAIFSPVQQEVNPMDPIIPQGQGGAPVAEGLANLSSLFLSAPTQQRAATQNELFGARVSEFREIVNKPDWSPAQATMGELRQFAKAYPEFGQEVFSAAKAGVNEELSAYESSLTTTQKVQNSIEESWLLSPEGVYANAKAQEFTNEEEGAAFIAQQRALWVTTSAENARIKREVETRGAYASLSADAYRTNTTSAKTEADIFARGVNELTLAIAADPTASFNLDETGITQLIPELRGTVVNQRNIVSVANIARGALETKFRNDISAKTGIDANQLGVAPDDWTKTVFNTFDTTLTWTANEVDPATIQKRLEGEAYTSMAQAGVPVQYLSTISRLSAANPTLAAQFMGSITGVVGTFNEQLMNGQLEEANRALQEASKQDLIDARYAFTELVAVMSGQSTLARTYEEVTQDQKDTEISVALTGAFKSHRELQRTEGPTRWNRAAWRQNFEVPAEAITRRAGVDTSFATEASSFMSSDIMLDLGNLRDAAEPNGVNISISENGQVVISAKDTASWQGTGSADLGVARRPLTPGDKLRIFTEENKAIIDDINYKMTVLGRLGGVGESTMAIIRAEVPTAETTTQAGGAGGGSASTATPIGEALGIDFTTLEVENGLPQGFLERTAFLESRGNPNAKNPKSSAGGLFQQTDGNAKDYGVKDRFDPVQSTDGAVDFAVDNMRILTRALGRKPTAAELYLAHQQGGEGARRLLSNPNAKAVDIVGEDAVRLNGGNVNMTASEFASLWLDKFNNAKTIAPTAGTPADANAVASRAGEAVQRAVNPSAGPVSVDVNLSSGGAPTAPMATGDMAEATLPEAIPTTTPAAGEQRVSELNPAIAVDPEVQAFIQEIAGDPDKSYATEAEFLAAQERGELEPGDTVVVNGDVYVIRKNGTARRLGTANA